MVHSSRTYATVEVQYIVRLEAKWAYPSLSVRRLTGIGVTAGGDRDNIAVTSSMGLTGIHIMRIPGSRQGRQQGQRSLGGEVRK